MTKHEIQGLVAAVVLGVGLVAGMLYSDQFTAIVLSSIISE